MTTTHRTTPPGRYRPVFWLLVLCGLGVAFLSDLPVRALATHDIYRFEKRDIVQFLRTGGYLFLWIGVALTLVLIDCQRAGLWTLQAARRGAVLALSVAGAGLAGELLKLIARRERMARSGAFYQYRPLWERPFETGGLSLPSSHAVVAFAAAFALGRLFPAARPVFLLYALGTAATRVYTGAHFVSDVYISFILALVVSDAVSRLTGATADHSHQLDLK